MPKRSSKKAKEEQDINILAKSILDKTTSKPVKKKKKNPAAVALGRLGGLKGGKARAKKMTDKELSEWGKKAAEARWEKKKK